MAFLKKQTAHRFGEIQDIGKILTVLKINELIDVNCANFAITPIQQGAINLNYKVQDKHTCILLKRYSKTNSLPISRSQVFRLQEELATIKLAPRPMFLSEDELYYCEEWIDFQPLCQNAAIRSLAEALYSVHNCYISAPIIPLSEHWQLYLQKIPSPSHTLMQQYLYMCEQWRAHVDEHKDQFVICHNDLHVSHVCSPSGPLLDWEYAGMGCRYFDIASCIAINQFNHAQKIKLCESYAELANKSARDVLNETQNVSAMVEFTNNIWNNSLGLSHSLQ